MGWQNGGGLVIYKVTVNGTQYDVVVDEGKVTVNGEAMDMSQMTNHLWRVDGQNLFIDRISGRLVNVENELYEIGLERILPIKRPEGADDAGGKAVVKAAMPGKIVRVPVKVGDTVALNSLIFVLEAMKMENEVLCPIDGKVVEVLKSAGDTVDADEAVLVIEG